MDKIVHAVVKGRGYFPMDMLRYDSCCPATEVDSEMITNTFSKFEKWEISVKKILLERKKKNVNYFTVGRWNSFSCEIEQKN